MGFRFSRRISLMPGVRINVGARGASLSLGPRGASVNVGKRGVHANVGLPGTGLSYRTRLDRPTQAPRPERPMLPTQLSAMLEGDYVVLSDQNGARLSAELTAIAKREKREELRAFLEAAATKRNETLEELARLHADVPTTVAKAIPYSGKPARATYADQQEYMQALMTWRAHCANHKPDAAEVETMLLDSLGALQWPRETNIALSFSDGRLLLDVDLPEIEDMPCERWTADQANMRLVTKPLAANAIARIYLAHVCALVYRLLGYGFATGSFIETVAISGYTQRGETVSGMLNDYVIVADVKRELWEAMTPQRIAQSDPEAVLQQLGAKFQANAKGILKTQQPIV